jgi:hypothetical protein
MKDQRDGLRVLGKNLDLRFWAGWAVLEPELDTESLSERPNLIADDLAPVVEGNDCPAGDDPATA